jgi:hypothetical protein
VKFYFKLISLNACTVKEGVTKPASVDALLANLDNLTGLKTLIEGAKSIKIAFAKAVSAYTRGAVCLACSGTDSVSSYFNGDDKVILSQASVKAYIDAASTALGNYNSLLILKSFNDAATSILTYYLGEKNSCFAAGIS